MHHDGIWPAHNPSTRLPVAAESVFRWTMPRLLAAIEMRRELVRSGREGRVSLDLGQAAASLVATAASPTWRRRPIASCASATSLEPSCLLHPAAASVRRPPDYGPRTTYL
jgi:hypothetical protein